MVKFFSLLLAGVLSLWASVAIAQSSYVQIEAKRTLAEAEAAARDYAQDFPNVVAFSLNSGWYAIALGPYSEAEALNRLNALLSEGLVPSDSFLAENGRFKQRVWPEGGVATLPATEPAAPLTEQAAEAAAEAATSTPATSEEAVVAEPEPVLLDETREQARDSEALLDAEARKLLQTALAFEGFYTSVIDGDFGPGTRKSMASWQEAKGYEVTGILTTRQRDELTTGYTQFVGSLGMAVVRDNTAGIEVMMPTALVERGPIEPPFANYTEKAGSKVQVILISQTGTQTGLFGLYDILQTLEIMPLSGERTRGDDNFTINGANGALVSHAEARLTDDGAIKGFVLVWPTGDEKRRLYTLSQMQASFAPIDGVTLPDVMGEGQSQDPDLLAGLEIRRPDLVRSGFYVDETGAVLTSAELARSCARLTLNDDLDLKLVASDAATGLALLRSDTPLRPQGFARFRTGAPRQRSEVAVAGYSYDGRLGAPVLTFGQYAEASGLNGEADIMRLDLTATPSDAGGPLLDGAGVVVGMLLPPAEPKGQVLPKSVSFARNGAAVQAFLAANGVTVTLDDGAGDVSPETLTRQIGALTVELSCWN